MRATRSRSSKLHACCQVTPTTVMPRSASALRPTGIVCDALRPRVGCVAVVFDGQACLGPAQVPSVGAPVRGADTAVLIERPVELRGGKGIPSHGARQGEVCRQPRFHRRCRVCREQVEAPARSRDAPMRPDLVEGRAHPADVCQRTSLDDAVGRWRIRRPGSEQLVAEQDQFDGVEYRGQLRIAQFRPGA